MSGYDYALSRAAARVLLDSSRAVQRRMERVLEQLCGDPFAEPDLHEAGESGRRYALRIFDDAILTYWVDHPAKEIKVIRIEFVEAGN